MIAVIDTNVLVSALMTSQRNAALVVASIISGKITPCYDYRIIEEYRDVLNRPKFGFTSEQVESLLDLIINDGFSVVPTPLPELKMIDETDRAFYEVAKFCNAPLVSGNIKHYPQNDPLVFPLADFVEKFL